MPITVNPNLRGAELAQAVAEYITEHPEEWDQDMWGSLSPCGTHACFAGTAILVSGRGEWFHEGNEGNYGHLVVSGPGTIHDVAESALGLSEDDAYELFRGQWFRRDNDEMQARLPLTERLTVMWSKVASYYPAGAITVPPAYQ